MFQSSFPWISIPPAVTNAVYNVVVHIIVPLTLLYCLRSFSRRTKVYIGVGYYASVLGHFALPVFVFHILKWVVYQILRGCKALAWFGFYTHFFVAGMKFVVQGYEGVLDFLAGLGKVMEEAREEHEREKEAEDREARARTSAPDYAGEEGSDAQRPTNPSEDAKQPRKKRGNKGR